VLSLALGLGEHHDFAQVSITVSSLSIGGILKKSRPAKPKPKALFEPKKPISSLKGKLTWKCMCFPGNFGPNVQRSRHTFIREIG
jgi:hypothetical protein